jgi:hypothetical protein
VPGTAANLRGFPAFAFQGTNAIRSISDPSQNANRDTRQEQTTISDTLTFVKGRHSLKAGGFYTRNHAVDVIPPEQAFAPQSAPSEPV